MANSPLPDNGTSKSFSEHGFEKEVRIMSLCMGKTCGAHSGGHIEINLDQIKRGHGNALE